MLDNIRISKSGMAEFAHDLTAKREFLEALVIRNNKVGDQGVRELCQALQRCLVEQLTVAYCNFGSKGYRSLVDLLSTEDYKSTLIHLDISGNKAGSTGSKCLSSWLLAGSLIFLCLSFFVILILHDNILCHLQSLVENRSFTINLGMSPTRPTRDRSWVMFGLYLSEFYG